MKNLLLYKFCSGKNSKWIYFGVNYIRFLTPKFIFRSKLKKTLANFSSCSDKAYIEQRVDYYNKLSISKQLPENASKLENHTLQKKRRFISLIHTSIHVGFRYLLGGFMFPVISLSCRSNLPL